MPRLEHDAYMTPPHYIAALLSEISFYGRVYEPCVGDGAIADALRSRGAVRKVLTNDLDTQRPADTHKDATKINAWGVDVDWVVTNPPFSDALPMLENALETTPNVVILARLSFLEPAADREYLLESCPPKRVIVLPRYSFRTNDAGKRQTDNVTCAWLVWGDNVEPGIRIWGKGKAHAHAVLHDLDHDD